MEYLQFGTTSGRIDTVRKKVARFLIMDDNLFKKGYNLSYLKCLGPTEAYNTLKEIHDRICGNHIDKRTLAHKTLRQGFYWPTIKKNS